MLANVFRQWTTPGGWYRNLYTIWGAEQQVNYDGDRNDMDYHAWVQATFKNYMNFSSFVLLHPSTYDERLTRGGPTTIRYGYNMLSTNFGTDSRARVVGNVGVQYIRPVDNTEGGRVSYFPSVTLKPSSRVLVSLSPSLDLDNTAQQYVTAVTVRRCARICRHPICILQAQAKPFHGYAPERDVRAEPALGCSLSRSSRAAKYSSFKEFASQVAP